MADYDLDTVSGKEIFRDISRIISHPGYVRTSNFPNDVALLELDRPVDLTSGDVTTACLPDKSMRLEAGTQCWISGWGETRGSGGQEHAMNEVPVDVVDLDACKGMWGRVNIDVLDSQVCLGYGDTGACFGDSGGPLMCQQEGRFYVAGVMSWLIKNCSGHNFPNVFTRVPNYMDWLYEQLDYFEWSRFQ
ncbi:mast cell tryptase-like [Aplysia californica]|uniref:Mast cell tryptase-like n=1 Tax=Aplysia californica TaxID=6500 RepID=A0ABM1W1G8_APLCA|nr:mast cell tryptase-like [Aplysia californica]